MSGSEGAALRAAMYGEHDLGGLSLFSGGFINFGYWPELTGAMISLAERTESQAALYRLVLGRLGIGPDDVVLEVGCGIGAGAALAVREFAPRVLHGLDLSAAQLARARAANAVLLAEQPERLVLREGSALAMPYPDAMFDRCHSVEAAQHFEDLATFARELWRVLKPGGRVVVSTFFTRYSEAAAELESKIETVASGIDVLRPITEFHRDLTDAGFVDIRVESIGGHVWPGFDAWMAQTEYRDSWGRGWLKAHRDGLVDYYLVSAERG